MRWSAPSLQDDLTRDVRPALLAVLAAVGVVLLLACVNVTNLLLVRGARRREEFALRAALASASVGALIGATPTGMPRADAIAVDWTVLLSAMLLTTCTGLVVGLLPALQASGQDRLAIDLGTARITGGRRRLLRSGLVASQVAFALVLLTGSGLLVRSMERLLAVSPGFDARGVVTMRLQVSPRRYADAGEVGRFFDGVLEAVQHVPGVTLESPPEVPPSDHREIFRYAVSPGYLELMRIPVRAGRALTGADRVDAPWAVVVNESFARRYLGDRDPLGQRLWIGPTDGQAYTVVGVVGDVKQLSLAGDVPDAVYTTTAQWRFAQHGMSLVVRGAGDAAAGQIVGLVLRFGARVTGVGLAVGVAGAVIGTRLMRAMLYGVSHLDVVTYGAVVVVLAVMATVACAVPALRAARIDPARALRG